MRIYVLRMMRLIDADIEVWYKIHVYYYSNIAVMMLFDFVGGSLALSVFRLLCVVLLLSLLFVLFLSELRQM